MNQKKLSAYALILAMMLGVVLPAFATTSTINPNVPANGSALSSAVVRSNFAAAYSDINTLYATALFAVPAPTTSVLGGVFAQSGATANSFMTYIDTAGTPHVAQPSFSNLSGLIALNQFPAQASNSLLGNGTNASAAPSALSVPSCSTSASALNWTSNTGFSCNTAIAASTVTTNANLTGDVTSVGNATTYSGVVPIATGGTNATTAGLALDNLTGATTTGGQWLNRTAAGTWNAQAPYKVIGTCSLLDKYPTFYDANPSITLPTAIFTPGVAGTTTYTGATARSIMLQAALLDCQRDSITAGAQHFASTHIPSCLRFVATGGPFLPSSTSPIVMPRYLCNDDAASWERDGSGAATPSANWNGDPTSGQLVVKQRPLIYYPIGGTTYPGSKTVANLNRVGTDRGAGFVHGMSWEVGSVTLQGTGTGIPGSTATCVARNGDTVTPASGASFTISVSGGVATAVTSSFTRYVNGGQYTLPPWAQRYQYRVANGWDGNSGAGNSDGRHPQVFADETNFYYKTTCSGVDYGLTVSVKWQPEWCTGVAPDGESVACTARTDGPNSSNSPFWFFGNAASIAANFGDIYALQSGQNFDATYGYNIGVMIDAFETTGHYVQTQKADIGLFAAGADFYLDHHNDVGSASQLNMRGGAGQHIMFAREDTPTDSVNHDAHAIKFDAEQGSSVAGTIFHNSGSASDMGTAQLRLGTDSGASNSTHFNTGNAVGPFTFFSDGTSGGNLTAFDCNYTRESLMWGVVSNLQKNGSARAQQYTKFINWGTSCDSSNFVMGQINNVSGSIFSGTDQGAGVFVWDGYAKGFALPNSTYLMYGSGAPTSGGSGTGLNKAGKGSLYVDYTNGVIYLNSGASSSPTWIALATGSGLTSRVFQLPGTLTVGNDITNWVIVPAGGTITKAWAIAKTKPTGQALIFDIKKSSDNGATFTSIWASTPANRIQIAAGSASGTQTSFDTTTVSAGDLLRIDVNQIGSGVAGADATVSLSVQ